MVDSATPAHVTDAGATARAETPGSSEDRASIEVVVFPRGDVWLDGVRLGPSPYTGVIAPGRHVVASGRGTDALRRVVDAAPGQRLRVILR